MKNKMNLSLRIVWTVTALTLAATALLTPTSARADATETAMPMARTKNILTAPTKPCNRPYSIGLWGDLPYSQSQAEAIPAMIEDMNSQDLVFTVQDGDLRQGGGVPSLRAENSSNGVGGIVGGGSIYQRGLNYFNALKAPAIFTTGDNDWTDW